MSYQVKWVEKHLGITRKALRVYEEKGLMPKNENGRYRSYDDSEIERIWTIRSLQAMGFSLKEIASFLSDQNLDLQALVREKIKELENQKLEIEGCINYAKAVKLYEQFPEMPDEMGSVTFEEFYEKTLNGWKNLKKQMNEDTQPIP